MSRLRDLGRSSVGKKAISAASGLVLLGFVLAHMFANLQILAGGGRIDAYARGLRAAPVLLWSVRALLASAFGVHVVVALQLAARRRRARTPRLARSALSRHSRRTLPLARSAPTLALPRGGPRERGPDRVPGRGQFWAARAMLASGVVLAGFVVVHLANLTWGVWHPSFVPLAVHHNVVALFQVRAWSAFYLVALAALALHAAHGAWSAPQSLGLTPERGAPGLRRLARGAAIAVATGLFAVVVAVLAGGVR
jgi:succinate dehydrogenase / fumarate reductase cytochrome b subunit